MTMTNLPADLMSLLSELRGRDFQIGDTRYARYYGSDYMEWVENQPVGDEAKLRFKELFKENEWSKASPFDVEMMVELLLHRAHVEIGNA